MLRTAKWWLPTAAMMLLSLLSYVDRNVLAILAQTILHDVGLSAEQYGYIISAFSAAYLLGNPVWGRLLDRFGVRAGLMVAVAIWTTASASHALAAGAVSFALARAALGFGEGATFPGGMRTASQTLRLDQQARGVAFAYSGGSLGAVLTPLIVTPIALRWGWRGAFLCTGMFGLAWLGAWAWVSRDERLDAKPAARDVQPPRLTHPSVWGFMGAYAFGGLPLGFILYGGPLYLARRLGCDQATLGHLLVIPPLGWEVGYFVWGTIVDRSSHEQGRAKILFGRFFAALSVLALPMAIIPSLESRTIVLALMFLAMFASAGFVIVSLSETTRRHSGQHGAYLAGLGAGSWSGLMALMMPIFGRLFDRQAYGAAFTIAALAPAVGWLTWLVASRNERGLATENVR